MLVARGAERVLTDKSVGERLLDKSTSLGRQRRAGSSSLSLEIGIQQVTVNPQFGAGACIVLKSSAASLTPERNC